MKTLKQAQSEIRAYARNGGMVFKRAGEYHNGKDAYAFYNKATGDCESVKQTMSVWRDCYINGEISSLLK